MSTWENLISYRRYGYDKPADSEHRSEFIRDYDRILFMSAFRRLQDKTQVFPLPGNVFVHNRLTHSLEVASVGRSLGTIIGKKIAESAVKELTPQGTEFYKNDLSGLIASACLAHDIGNPAFGHSGEKAIAYYFQEHENDLIEGQVLRHFFDEASWKDLIQFEGNANALRHLTRQFIGKMAGGQRLTYLTLVSILKYPCDSLSIDKSRVYTKKYGFFQSEKKVFLEIADEFRMEVVQANGAITGHRHPFVYLVEAADDICYRIIDMEDAHRIGIISLEEISSYFLMLLEELYADRQKMEGIQHVLHRIGDKNEKVSYLRAKCISVLISRVSEVFIQYQREILDGTWNHSLMDILEEQCPSLIKIDRISVQKIYNHHSVIEVELAGYNVMSALLGIFIPAILKEKPSNIEQKSLLLIPDQFNLSRQQAEPYDKVMGVLDFVSGMTDGYATELYRKVKGIDISSHKG
jgi:dGTPase